MKNQPEDGSIAADVEVMSRLPGERLALTPEEAAMKLGLHINTVYALLAARRLPGVKAGRRWLVPRRPLEAWLDGQGGGGDDSGGV